MVGACLRAAACRSPLRGRKIHCLHHRLNPIAHRVGSYSMSRRRSGPAARRYADETDDWSLPVGVRL